MAWLATQVVGVVNAHSQSQRLNLGHGFESLYRVAGSATQMLRKKKFYVAVQELFTFQNYFWNNKLFGCTNSCWIGTGIALKQNLIRAWQQHSDQLSTVS